MKKLMLCVLLLVAAPLTFAEEATGTIEEIKLCGTGSTSGVSWVRTLQFKIDDKWFGIYADHYGSDKDYDNNISTSLLYMAFSQNLEVHINATGDWSSYMKKCGITEGFTFRKNAGDFISLSK